MSTLCSEKDHFKFFTDNGQHIILKILIPILRLSQEEREKVITDGSEFMHFIRDIVEDRKSKVPKTHAMELLERIAVYTDGMHTFVTKLCISMISKGINISS